MNTLALLPLLALSASLAAEATGDAGTVAKGEAFTPRWTLLSFGFREVPAYEVAEGRFEVYEAGGRYEIKRNNAGLTRVKPISEDTAKQLLGKAATAHESVPEPVARIEADKPKPAKAPAPSPLARKQSGWRKTADQERSALVMAVGTTDEQIADIADQVKDLAARQDSLEDSLRDLRMIELRRQRLLLVMQQQAKDRNPELIAMPEDANGKRKPRPQVCLASDIPASTLFQQIEINDEIHRVERKIRDLGQQRTELRQRRAEQLQQIAAKEAYIAELDQALAKD